MQMGRSAVDCRRPWRWCSRPYHKGYPEGRIGHRCGWKIAYGPSGYCVFVFRWVYAACALCWRRECDVRQKSRPHFPGPPAGRCGGTGGRRSLNSRLTLVQQLLPEACLYFTHFCTVQRIPTSGWKMMRCFIYSLVSWLLVVDL